MPQMGANPRGLQSQMDVIHILTFGKLSFIHVCADTFSGLLFATARTGEGFKDVLQHLFVAFTFMGMPKHIKTDNSPAYMSKSFAQFFLLRLLLNTLLEFLTILRTSYNKALK